MAKSIPTTATISATAFGLVALELPIGIENPLARLYATRARMAALKGSYQALLTFALLGATGMAPSFVEEQVLKVLASKTTAVMTNVPGAQQARYFAGQKIDQQLVWGPASRRHRYGSKHPFPTMVACNLA
jgi:diacylglycerol O-acyltransferase